MSSKRFLITGATGATGGKTLKLLLERGYQVRAFVHQHDERSVQLEKQGVEERKQQVVLRARIVLAAAQGSSNTQVARELDINIDTVRLWRDRWARWQEIE